LDELKKNSTLQIRELKHENQKILKELEECKNRIELNELTIQNESIKIIAPKKPVQNKNRSFGFQFSNESDADFDSPRAKKSSDSSTDAFSFEPENLSPEIDKPGPSGTQRFNFDQLVTIQIKMFIKNFMIGKHLEQKIWTK